LHSPTQNIFGEKTPSLLGKKHPRFIFFKLFYFKSKLPHSQKNDSVGSGRGGAGRGLLSKSVSIAVNFFNDGSGLRIACQLLKVIVV
jgi:hypothetical protein